MRKFIELDENDIKELVAKKYGALEDDITVVLSKKEHTLGDLFEGLGESSEVIIVKVPIALEDKENE